MEDTQSRSVWAFVDQGSGPLKVAAKSIEAMSAKMAMAERASSSMSKQLGADASKVAVSAEREQQKLERASQQRAAADRRLGLMQLEAGEMNKAFDEKKAGPAAKPMSEMQEIRAEAMARRMRTRGLKLEEQQGDIAENAMAQFAAMLGATTNPIASSLTKFGQNAEGVGFQMSAFGGKLGGIGAKLVDVGGKLGMIGAAFGVAYTAMSALDEATGLTDWISGAESVREVAAKNERYAKASGYATIELYKSAQEIGSKTQKDIELKRRTEEAAQKLGAMPLDKTSQAMSAWESQLMGLVGKTARAGDDMSAMVQTMREAAEKSSKTWLLHQKESDKLNTTLAKTAIWMAKGIPGEQATDEMKAKYREELVREIDRKVASGEIEKGQRQEALSLLEAKSAERGNVQEAIEEYAEHSISQQMLAEAVAAQAKAMGPLTEKTMSTSTKFAEMGTWLDKMQLRFPELGKNELKDIAAQVTEKRLAKGRTDINFNNAKFDIKQAFAEGFDPDRIAVAFTNDLAMLGERRLQSGLAPIYAAR